MKCKVAYLVDNDAFKQFRVVFLQAGRAFSAEARNGGNNYVAFHGGVTLALVNFDLLQRKNNGKNERYDRIALINEVVIPTKDGLTFRICRRACSSNSSRWAMTRVFVAVGRGGGILEIMLEKMT